MSDALSLPDEKLFARADRACRAAFGNKVHLRGLIEVSNRCVMDCAYCGIRRGNPGVARYAHSDEEVLESVRAARAAGLRSFVLQGAEDPDFGPERLARLAGRIREIVGEDTAITYSFGTLRRRDYALLRRAGVDRYLLRFETSDEALHLALRGSPLSRRLRALEDLRELGFEVGSGFMTGLPGADEARLRADVGLAVRLGLDMVGVGPFIPHPGTPLGRSGPTGPAAADLGAALRAVAALRLGLPGANIPATTAAGSVAPDGRERMLASGANVLMPNVGPVEAKKDYELYPGKICLDEDGLKCVGCLSLRVKSVGKELDFGRGDSPSFAARRASEGPPAADVAASGAAAAPEARDAAVEYGRAGAERRPE